MVRRGHKFEKFAAALRIDEMYEALKAELDKGQHEEECAYRCLNVECRLDHGCAVCADNEFLADWDE